ncbi:hypothetical protein ES332_A02G028600v1 [Gossypium tomentosum]|uniref:Uncharacterized protein n=1 Tax=Gossypium tomentosum TaxID=34277 RepID=A0A5D2RF87_GOSTO|nr:hypothetical protein ES332_A02G028600v1 [Gossypium tomentosum]
MSYWCLLIVQFSRFCNCPCKDLYHPLIHTSHGHKNYLGHILVIKKYRFG